MSLLKTVRNKNIASQLSKSLTSGRLCHAYILCGDADGRLTLARDFAKAIFCKSGNGDYCDDCAECRKFDHFNQGDYIEVAKEGLSVKTVQVEALRDRLKYKAIGDRIVAVVDDAHTMNIAAQNKLLKTLEEPLGGAVIILLTERMDALLPTVLSRCMAFHLEEPAASVQAGMSHMADKLMGLMYEREPFYKRKDIFEAMLKDKDNSKAEALLFLDVFEDKLSEQLKSIAVGMRGPKEDERQRQTENAIIQVEQTRKALKSAYNTAANIKLMCLKI